MGGHEAYPLKLGNLIVYHTQKRRKISSLAIPLVGIDILAKERHFLKSGQSKALYLVHYIRRVSGALTSSYIRHYAVRAKVVAAVGYICEGGKCAVPANRQPLRYLAVHVANLQRALSVICFLK